jgi:catechol 2,3-dioxygenase-like lactoylglutathione lyase family enzyme
MTRLLSTVVPALLAKDLDETLAFYAKLGFAVTGRSPADAPRWAEVARDEVRLQFHLDPPHGTPAEPVMSGTLYLRPDSVEELAAELRDTVPFAWGPEVMPYGMRELAVQDPNGYYLAFAEPA